MSEPDVLTSAEITKLNEGRRHLAMLKKRERMKEENGLLFYEPHTKQDAFHKAGKNKGRYARTGNRFGKSEMGVCEDIAWALGERIWYKEGDPARYAGIPKRPVKILVVCQDWDNATEVFTSMEKGDRRGKMFRFLPKAAIVGRPHRNHSGHIDKIVVKSKWGGESIITFDTTKSFMVNPMGAESKDYDAIHVDEPIPQAFWKAISRGLVDRHGSYWFTCTPLREMWINDHFIPAHLIRSDISQPLQNGTKWVMTGSMKDNPHLTLAAIADFEDSLTEDEKACRIDGIPTALSGVVYKAYDPMRHIYGQTHEAQGIPTGWESWIQLPRDYTYRVSIDPHPKTPHAILFAATSPHGQTFIFHEIFTQILVKDLCSLIKTVLDGRHIHEAICDPFAWIPNPITGYTMADEFWANGIPVQKATKELAYGILRTNEELKKDDGLYFHDSLRETKWEFDHYVWQDNKEKPVDKDDHMMECLYRLVLTGLTYVEPGESPGVVAPMAIGAQDFRVGSVQSAMRGLGKSKKKNSYSLKKSRYRS
tara:strand:- start:9286 stop:10893 length:1608 start_codon:yes stop_codon:yes gene_type:complete